MPSGPCGQPNCLCQRICKNPGRRSTSLHLGCWKLRHPKCNPYIGLVEWPPNFRNVWVFRVCVCPVCVWIKWWLDEGGSCGNVVQGFCVSAACESFHFPGSGFFHSDSTSHYHQLTAIWSPTNAECDGFEVKAVDAQYNVQPESIEPFGTFSLARPRDMHIYAYVYDCLCIFVQTHCLWWSEAEMQRQSAYGCRNVDGIQGYTYSI